MSEIKQRIAHIRSQILPEGIEKNFVVLLLLLTLVKGLLFAFIVPKWQAPDEPSYFKYTKILADEKRIPTAEETRAAGHPPLFPIISIVPYTLAKPFGKTAQVFSIRFLSLLFSIAVVWLGFKTAFLVFPENRFVQFLVPTLLAFSPQYSFISSSINSDSLLILLFSLMLYQLALIINSSLTWEQLAFLFVTFSLGVFTKERFLVILPPLILVLIYELYRIARTKFTLKTLRQSPIPALVIVSLYLFFIIRWWEKFKISMVIGEKLRSAVPYYASSSLRELFLSRNFPGRTFEGFWGYFGWLSIPLRQEMYQAIKVLMALSLVGIVIWLGKTLRYLFSHRTSKISGEQVLTLAVFGLSICLALYATAAYDIVTGGGQGRYMLIAAVPIFLFISLGLDNLFPKTFKRRAFGLLYVSMFVLNAASLFYIIFPWYYQ